MVQRFGQGTVAKTKTALDGVIFTLTVLRNEHGTQVVVEAVESKPGLSGQGAGCFALGSQPYDPEV